MKKHFLTGLKKGLPIALGYFTVSFAFGVTAVNQYGFSPLMATIYSLINLSSTGQLAGVEMVFNVASYIEIGVATLLINLRYLLMSLSLTQKLDKKIKWYQKAVFGFGVTDETYAIAITEPQKLTAAFMFGLPLLPLIGWVGGTLLGSLCSTIFPENLINAMGIALYAMFIAIIVPDAVKSLPITIVILIAIGISCALTYIPVINEIGSGIKVIIVAVVSAVIGALIFPIKDEKKKDELKEEINENMEDLHE